MEAPTLPGLASPTSTRSSMEHTLLGRVVFWRAILSQIPGYDGGRQPSHYATPPSLPPTYKKTRCTHGLGKIYTSHTISQSWSSFPWSPFCCKNTFVIIVALDTWRDQLSHPSSRSNIQQGKNHFLAIGILKPPPINGRPLSSMSLLGLVLPYEVLWILSNI